MTLSDLKIYFRTLIKPVPGGPPVGTVGSNRSTGVLAALDKVAEFADSSVTTYTAYQLDQASFYASPDLAALPINRLVWLHPNRTTTAVAATYPAPRALLTTNRPLDGSVLAYLDAQGVAVPVPVSQPGPYLALALSDTPAMLRADPPVVRWALYTITGDWNAAGTDSTVLVPGLTDRRWASTGWVFDAAGKAQAVTVDVQAQTWQVAVVDAYTKAQTDGLLATKQPTILEYVFVDLYGATTYTLAATHFNKCVSFSSLNPVTVRLPKLTLADVPTTLLLVNDNDPATRPNAVLTFRGEHPVASGFVDVLCVLQPGERQPLHITDLPQLASPPALPPPPKPVYVTLGNPAALGAVTPAQLAVVATTLPLTTARTADYTLALSDAGCLVPLAGSGSQIVTLPDNAAVPLPVGSVGYVRRTTTGSVHLLAASGVQLLPPGVTLTLDDYGEVSWQKVDLNTYWLKGDLV